MAPVFVKALNLIDVDFTEPVRKTSSGRMEKAHDHLSGGGKRLGSKDKWKAKPSRKSISTLRTQLAEAGSFFRSGWRDITLFTLRTSMDRR